jgi:hypothetical protein
MKLISVFSLFSLGVFTTIAAAQQKDSFAIQLYGEVYASAIPNKPFNNLRPAFHYNYTKANGVGMNLALARIHYSTQKFRTNLGFMAGDYPTANLAAEDSWARTIYEANVGFKLSKQKDIWVDAGVLPSHIGFETAIGRDNWSATRSIVADNSPYYETGIRFSYQINSKLYASLLAFTGWQRITFPRKEFQPAFGTQVLWKPSSKIAINHSTYLGTAPYTSVSINRYYSNLFGTIQLHPKLNAVVGWDFGWQPFKTGFSNTAFWNAWNAQFQYKPVLNKWHLTARYERFIDRSNILFELPEQIYHQFNVHHLSFNLDRFIGKGFLLRAEANYQSSPYPIFRKEDMLAYNQFSAFLIASYNFQYSKKR